ncbi:GntP family permease [Cellulophaga sp. E6(2014)]|uniref:GntP family permease n=1 Tax=Cellulophaga sp. E6(2014) TaxID=1495334 RepID=UPI00051CC014|nr:SLC13 family permease [Cellulophaga sp. E6(2014)]KGK30222.1 gluconate transporter [Cellulophaga sp. E6(2014)]
MTALITLILCITLLIVAITIFKIHPIPALLFFGLLLGLATGGTVSTVTESLLNGFGNTLKWIGLIIFFGAFLGEILSESGGAEIIANTIIKVFGVKFLPLSMAFIGFLIGIPVFMDVAYLTLLPTLQVLSKKSGHSILVLGLSLAMSLTVAHALIPPTPGPLAVAALLEVNVGDIIPLNMLIAIFAIGGGLIWLQWNKTFLQRAKTQETIQITAEKKQLKGFKKILPFVALLLPLALMSIGAIYSSDNQIIAFIKNPIWALSLGILCALPLISTLDFSKTIHHYFQNAASKTALVILITGTGGAFGQVIKDTEIVNALFSDIHAAGVMVIIIPFLLSMLFTTVTGSITVSLITTASIVAPLIANGMLDPKFTTAAICAGSLGVIHVNSSFFWLFKEVHDISVSKLLKSFSVLSLLTSLSGGVIVLATYYIKELL